MILSDINLLLYGNDSGAKQHVEAKQWLKLTLAEDILCLSWHSIMGFLRISTSPRIYPNPYSATEALSIIQNLIDHPNSRILDPGKHHFQILERIVRESQISGPKLMDAHLAALAIEHGTVLASNDRDFRLFDGLNLINPLTILN